MEDRGRQSMEQEVAHQRAGVGSGGDARTEAVAQPDDGADERGEDCRVVLQLPRLGRRRRAHGGRRPHGGAAAAARRRLDQLVPLLPGEL